MVLRKLIAPVLLVIAVAVAFGVYQFGQVARHAGITVLAAAPATLVPATADMYVELNRGGDQGAALSHLWQVYQAHPGTAAALAHLRAGMQVQSGDLTKMNDLLAALGDQAAVAVWMPPAARPNDAHVAVVTQLKVLDLLQGKSPLDGLATTAPLWSYEGIQVYHVIFKHDATPAFGCIISSDGVLASDAATIKRVIDAATGHAPALASNKGYGATLATLPSSRSFTLYLAPSVSALASKQLAANSGAMPSSVQSAMPTLPIRPYGVAMSASNDGVAFSTSALPGAGLAANVTANAAAAEVGGNTVLYTSQDNLAAALAPVLRLVPRDTLAQMESKLDISLQRDVLSWMNGEFAITVNDSASPLVAQALRGAMNGSGGNTSASPAAVPALPGSVALAWHVDNPDAVRRALDRIAAAAMKATGSPQPVVSRVSTPDGTPMYTIMGMPSLGYVFHGKWLIASSNLTADAATPRAPLSADAGYTTALGHVAGANAPTSVAYVDLTRLLGIADKWMAFASRSGNGAIAQAAQSAGWTWPQAESLIAPLHSVIVATHPAGKDGMTVNLFVAIKS